MTEGIGLAHTMSHLPPLPGRAARQPRKQSTIELRWKSRWEYICAVNSKLATDPAAQFADYRRIYNRRIAALLRANIAWTTIMRGSLDSPLEPGVEFDRALVLAIEHRQQRMGRIKGVHKKRSRRHASKQRNGGK